MQPYQPDQPQPPYAPQQPSYPPQQPSSSSWSQTPPPPPTGSYAPTMPGQAQWQTQPPQPYTPVPGQMPNWQGGPMPPRKKSRKGLWIAIGIVVLVIIIIGAAANAGKGTSNSPQPTQSANGSTPTQASQPTAAPTPANAGMHKVGEAVTLDNWTVTVNSVKTSTGGQYDTVQHAGDVFLEVNVSILNNTGQSQPVSSILSFTLKDSTGQKYDETFVSDASSSPDGTLANGGKLKGTISYEVPKNTKSFEFDFTPSITNTDVATWNLTV